MAEQREILSFSHEFDDEFVVGPGESNRAFFGRNVLRGLIEGIDDFVADEPPSRKSHYQSDPAMLGSAMWINDPEVIGKLGELSGACIVVTKQPRKDKLGKLEPLHELNARTPGVPISALPALGGLAPKVEGEPLVVGPYTRMDEGVVPTIRTLGFRGDFPPLMHAKLALLGHLWWTDDGEFGEEIIGFKPRRLWVSSANFTSSSRRSLEFGYWTEEDALVEGAERFLVRAIALSEDLDAEADHLEPDLAPVEFDEVAIAEVLADTDWDEDEDEDEEA